MRAVGRWGVPAVAAVGLGAHAPERGWRRWRVPGVPRLLTVAGGRRNAELGCRRRRTPGAPPRLSMADGGCANCDASAQHPGTCRYSTCIWIEDRCLCLR